LMSDENRSGGHGFLTGHGLLSNQVSIRASSFYLSAFRRNKRLSFRDVKKRSEET
jgi:hypothetical protein